jgi:predicted metal-dependent hydrolase
MRPTYIIMLPDSSISVAVARQRQRTMRIHVGGSDDVTMTVPWFTSKEEAESFAVSKTVWIQKALASYKKKDSDSHILRDGSAALSAGFSFGDSYPAYSELWKKAAMENYRDSLERMFLLFAPAQIPFPELKGRVMKSLWGSCNRQNNVVTLNWALFRAPQQCIDYVVLHELTHFVYLHHDKNFYSFIEKRMSDYKTWRRVLDYEVGLVK